MKELRKEFLESVLDEYKEDKSASIFRHALNTNSLSDVVSSRDNNVNLDFNFDIEVKTRTATAQKSTGRCWIFAACNMMRERIANVCDIEEFELSESYIAFYDKIEKCNYFMKSVEDLLDKDYDDRTLHFILQEGLREGGQWDMVGNIINKYGLLPKKAYPDTYNANNSAEYRKLLSYNLRKFSYEAKKLYDEKGIEEVRKLEEDYLRKIYKLLVSLYGIPPKEFDFEYTNKEGKCVREHFTSPLEFKEKYVGNYLDEFISIVNLPTETKPFNKVYETDYQNNVIEGSKVKYLNVELARFKELILNELKDNQIVWFGADVSYLGDRKAGYFDDKAYDYLTPTGLDYDMPKAEVFNYQASNIGHAMCLTGASLKNNEVIKWKVENSWGTEVGNKGYFIMSGTWFDKFVYQAVINKKYLNKEELAAIEEEHIKLSPWDVLGN